MAQPGCTVAVVSVHFDPERLAKTLSSLRSLRARLDDPRLVYVANSPAAEQALSIAREPAEEQADLLVHDNTGWEFGAYQAGLDRALRLDPAWILFANDTFSIHQDFPKDYEDSLLSELGRRVEHPIAVGQIVSLRQSFVIAGQRTHRWITSNIFALNRAAVAAIGGRVYDAALEAAIRETSDRARFFADEVHPVLSAHMAAWLFESGDAPHWYRSQQLDDDNVAAMAGKARSILQEKRLTALLEGASAELVDIKEIGLLRELRRRIRLRLLRSPAIAGRR